MANIVKHYRLVKGSRRGSYHLIVTLQGWQFRLPAAYKIVRAYRNITPASKRRFLLATCHSGHGRSERKILADRYSALFRNRKPDRQPLGEF